MQEIYVSTILSTIMDDKQQTTLLLGEEAGELLFYSIKSIAMQGEQNGMAPLFRLKFEWDEAFYSSEFFYVLLSMMSDDDALDYFGELLKRSDIRDDAEIARLVGVAFDRMQNGEVLA